MNTGSPAGLDRRRAEWLLAGVVVARSTSYLFTKTGMETMGPFNLLALRFLPAFFLLAALFWRRLRTVTRPVLRRGAVLGALFFLTLSAELTGLRLTDSATTSFLENTAVVFVPLMDAGLRRRPPRPAVLAGAGVTLLGIGLLTFRNGVPGWRGGEVWCLLAAVLYAAAILTTDRFSHQAEPLTMGIVQVGFVGLFSLAAAFLLESPRLPATGREWGLVLALSLVCSAFGSTFQPMAQRGTTADRAGMFCALNPLTAALLGRLFLHETLGPRGLLGAALVLAGMLLSAKWGRAGAST